MACDRVATLLLVFFLGFASAPVGTQRTGKTKKLEPKIQIRTFELSVLSEVAEREPFGGGDKVASAGRPISYRIVPANSFAFALESVLQDFGFSLNPRGFEKVPAECEHLTSSIEDEEMQKAKIFWTDPVPLDERAMKALGVNRDLLGLNPDQKLFFEFQLAGCYSVKVNTPLPGAEFCSTEARLEMAVLIDKRGAKSVFVPEKGPYNSKPLLDWFYQKMKEKISRLPKSKTIQSGTWG